MLKLVVLCLGILVLAAAVLGILRVFDMRADQALIDVLTDTNGSEVPTFDPAMTDGLPEPAARFFRFSIADGTPLRTTAVIKTTGDLSLGTKDEPNYQEMHANQVLSPPDGFVWQVRLAGPSMVTGSDAYREGGSWSRFRLLNLVPVGRVAQDADHLRSSFGRMVGKGLFWTPAAFLPASNADWDDIQWEAIDDDTAAVTVVWVRWNSARS